MPDCVALPAIDPETPLHDGECLPALRSETCETRIRSHVHRILGRHAKQPIQPDARRDARVAYPHLLYLTPVDDQGHPLTQLATVVVGKNLAERGLDFFHSEPIPYRRVIITLETPEGRPVHLLTDLTWCRFTRHGWYDNGGRFLDIVPETSFTASRVD